MDSTIRIVTARQGDDLSQPAAPPAVALASPKRSPRRKSRRGWLFLAVLLLAGGGAAAWFVLGNETPQGRAITEAVLRQDIEDSVTAAGVLVPIRDVNVGAQVSGQLKSVAVEIGDRVQEGQIIAEIDSASIENRIEVNEAELANLEATMIDRSAQLVLKRSSLERQRGLAAKNSATPSAVEEAVAALATAQSNVDALRAQIRKQQAELKDARTSLGYTKIYAPMSGTVVSIAAKEGQTLNANQSAPTIATIADLSTITVEAQVSEADVGKLATGMEAYFTLLGQPGKRYTGTLRQIQPTPETTNNVVLYNALFDVPNPDGTLMIDMTAQVFFVRAAARNVLSVPLAALAQDKPSGKAAGPAVTVVTPVGARERRSIETGIANRVRVEVKSGLAEGEKVVVGMAKPGDAASSERGGRSQRAGLPPSPF